MNKRVLEFDIAKGLAIILMVVGHCNHFFAYDSYVFTLIYGFHMPLFLFLSGAALRISEDSNPKETSIGAMIKKKFHALLVPYFVVGFISILLSNPVDIAAPASVLLVGQAANADMNFNLPLWFLPMLFCSMVLFWISFCSTRGSKWQMLVSLLLSAIGGYFVLHRTAFAWSIELAMLSQVFIWAGFTSTPELCRIFEKPLHGKKLVCCLCAFSVLLAIYFLSVIHNRRVDMNARLINHPAMFLLNAALGIVFMLILSHLIRHIPGLNPIVSFLGTHTLDILCWHIPCANLFYGHVVSQLSNSVQQVIWGGSGKLIALMLLLLFVIPLSMVLHAVVFSSWRKVRKSQV